MRRELAHVKKLEFFNWLSMPLVIRKPHTDTQMSKQLGISMPTIGKWKKEYRKQKEEGIACPNYNSQDYLDSRSREADEALMENVKHGSAQDRRTYYQLTGRLVEKSEIDHRFHITAKDLIGIEERARERALELTGGKGIMPPEPPLLLDEVREDTGAKQGDNPI